MTPTLLCLLRPPLFVMFITAAVFCLQHPAGLSSTYGATNDLSGGRVPRESSAGRLTRHTHQDCGEGDPVPAGGFQSVIKTPDYRIAEFYIYPRVEFRGLRILLHGWSSNSTLQYPRDVMCLSDSLKWYKVNIDISTSFDKVVVQLKTNLCSLRCVTEISDVAGPDDVQCMEVVAVGAAEWMTGNETPRSDLQITSSTKRTIPPEENCNHTVDPNPIPHDNSTTTASLPTSTPTSALSTLYLTLILVCLALVVVVIVAVVVVMVVHRKRSSRETIRTQQPTSPVPHQDDPSTTSLPIILNEHYIPFSRQGHSLEETLALRFPDIRDSINIITLDTAEESPEGYYLTAEDLRRERLQSEGGPSTNAAVFYDYNTNTLYAPVSTYNQGISPQDAPGLHDQPLYDDTAEYKETPGIDNPLYDDIAEYKETPGIDNPLYDDIAQNQKATTLDDRHSAIYDDTA